METEFVSPNWHVALVHFPLALLIVGTLIELFSFLWRRHGFRAAGRWMILLGALSGIPTALAGVYALNDVARMGLNPALAEGPWREVAAASPLSPAQWDMLEDHVWLQASATLLAVLASILWIACSDLWRGRLHLPLLLLLLVSVGLTVAGAWHGGEAVYRYGTGVSAIHPPPQALAQVPPVARAAPGAAATAPSTAAAAPAAPAAVHEHSTPAVETEPRSRIEYYAPPLELHVVLAGTTVAIALAALGLSIRKITQGPPVTQVDHIAAALGPPPTLIGAEGAEIEPLPQATEPQDVSIPRVPASRFWMLAFFLALLTAAGGLWVLSGDTGNWDVKEMWEDVRQNARQYIHVLTGGAIAVLSLILAAFARWAPRQRWLLVIFALLLLLAVALQVWLGVLLMYDGMEGPLTKFT